MKTRWILCVLLAVCAVAADAGRDDVRAVEEEFRDARPPAEQLAIYQLDWAPTLAAAKERAAKEHRPIFLIIVRNSYGNMFTGHC